ncbi:hypothetical protein [Alienimonas chondri]|uniref:Uncharacterized protein n=1 Tax=Alienimonas chondri TaxID=2681879 RepID=A0ABX1VCQ8_9PLAN|nr:hypothetical protein [Alienimonas chondri]NNJ25489.1 hypothetical protein [Alienimonas chondri]
MATANEAERCRRELRGTLLSVAVYSLIAFTVCVYAFPAPYGMMAGVGLALFYGGAILLFGQGAIVEMGVLAYILLIHALLLGPVFYKD